MTNSGTNRRIGAIAITALVMGLASCKKEPLGNDPLPKVSDTPSISLKSISPTVVKELDGIEFTIFYLDGNGDIGFYEADSNSLFITDNRFPLTEAFHVKPLAPYGSSIAIQGELVVTLNNVILKDPTKTSEQATFTIKLKDRAGNWSEEVTSSAVTVTK